MYLRVHLKDADPYEIGEGIGQVPLVFAIAQEADCLAADAGSDLLADPGEQAREELRQRVIREMTAALVRAGDGYRAPDGVRYSLVESL